MRDHVPVDPELALPPAYAHVEDFLARHDAELRIRRSIERPGLFVLERRVRHRPAANLGMEPRTDLHIQARDGYLHISTVHSSWLEKPWNIVRALSEHGVDLWDAGAEKVADELDYEERWLKESRRWRRKRLFQDICRESYQVMRRVGAWGERDRISNVGVPST